MHQPLRQMGKDAVASLVDLISHRLSGDHVPDPQGKVYPTELVIRSSVSPAKP